MQEGLRRRGPSRGRSPPGPPSASPWSDSWVRRARWRQGESGWRGEDGSGRPRRRWWRASRSRSSRRAAWPETDDTRERAGWLDAVSDANEIGEASSGGITRSAVSLHHDVITGVVVLVVVLALASAFGVWR